MAVLKLHQKSTCMSTMCGVNMSLTHATYSSASTLNKDFKGVISGSPQNLFCGERKNSRILEQRQNNNNYFGFAEVVGMF
jgi:hypothetical protein